MSEEKNVPEESPAVKTKKGNGWKIAGIVVLVLLLPVLVPVGLALLGGLLMLALACLGGIFAVGLALSGCALTALFCLAAVFFCSLAGTGFGIVMLGATPASGLAVLGVSLIGFGLSVMGGVLVWLLIKLLIKACACCGRFITGLFTGKKGRICTNEA